jgi:hypothetical protein
LTVGKSVENWVVWWDKTWVPWTDEKKEYESVFQ